MTARRVPRWSEVRPLLRPRRAALNSTDRRLAAAASIADLRVLARRRAPRAVFDYTDGGAGDELVDVLGSRILLRPSEPGRSRRFYRDTLGLAVYGEFGAK
jgi:hypothetical protein